MFTVAVLKKDIQALTYARKLRATTSGQTSHSSRNRRMFQEWAWEAREESRTTSKAPGITFVYFPSQFSLSSPIASWNVEVSIGPSAQPGSYPIVIVATSGTPAYNATVTVVCQ
jgi:hypothetical protein